MYCRQFKKHTTTVNMREVDEVKFKKKLSCRHITITSSLQKVLIEKSFK